MGTRHAGYTREEIASMTGICPNGEFTKMLKALVGSDFVTPYVPFGESARALHYRLTDCFCWFWLHFKEKKQISEADYWQHHLKESEILAWSGIAFEEVCQQHVSQIKQTLQIAGVSSQDSMLIVRGSKEKSGMQIDLVIDRADDVVNVCEMKFTGKPFAISKSYAGTLRERKASIEALVPKKSFLMTLVTTEPIHRNEYSDIFSAVVTLDDLFR